jgi:hypothetical protein
MGSKKFIQKFRVKSLQFGYFARLVLVSDYKRKLVGLIFAVEILPSSSPVD